MCGHFYKGDLHVIFMNYDMKIKNFHKVAGCRLQVAGVNLLDSRLVWFCYFEKVGRVC